MDYIDFEREGLFLILKAVQPEGRLSCQCAGPGEVDEAVRYLKHQIDVAANRMKMALQQTVDPFDA